MSGDVRPFAPVMHRLWITAALAASLFVGAPLAVAEPSLGGEEGIGYSWDSTELVGRLVRRTPRAVVVEDGAGAVHVLRLTEQTRYVWSERSGPVDLAPGAKIRAELDAEPETNEGRVVLALWVLEGPR